MPNASLIAIGFDLGDTLIEYEGLPLSWVAHYDEALRRLATHLGVAIANEQVKAAGAVLRKYNTRLNPRDHEVPFQVILRELLAVFHASESVDEFAAAGEFFAVFRQRLRAFPDARSTLETLRGRGIRVGCFTDVPYGMPTALVKDDLTSAGLDDVVEVLITSRDAGVRKPHRGATAALARALGASAATFMYVGNEEKDVASARAFGCHAVLLDRTAVAPEWGQSATIRTLMELPALA